MERTLENASRRDRIRVDFKPLSSTNAGFATVARDNPQAKMRIALHDQLSPESRYGVLCHELAHIYLGHLGTDQDGWWPSRVGLDLRTIEIEAESVAYIVAERAGLQGTSDAYLAGYLRGEDLPKSVSLDWIGKVASRIEEMSRRKMPDRPKRGERARGNV